MITFLSVFPPYRGGISTFSDYLYKHLSKNGARVTAINFSRLYPPILFPGTSQFTEEEEKSADNYPRLLHSYNPFNWKPAAAEILEQNPRHLLISYWHPFFAPAFLNIIRRIRKRNPGIQVTLLVHNVVPHEHFPFGKSLSRAMLNTADQVILLSRQSQIEAEKLGISSQVHTLFHPVYEQIHPPHSKDKLREKYNFTTSDHILLFFGLVRPYKGLDILIEALNGLHLDELNIKVLIAGEFYTDESAITAKIKPEHSARYAIINRFISNEEMAEVFSISDVLVMPYRRASQSGILANAINFGLPVIASDLPGLTEHLEHGKNALIVRKEDARELREAIKTLLDSEVRLTMAAHVDALNKELSWDKFTSRVLALLQ